MKKFLVQIISVNDLPVQAPLFSTYPVLQMQFPLPEVPPVSSQTELGKLSSQVPVLGHAPRTTAEVNKKSFTHG